jgi:hypothetical protein
MINSAKLEIQPATQMPMALGAVCGKPFAEFL